MRKFMIFMLWAALLSSPFSLRAETPAAEDEGFFSFLNFAKKKRGNEQTSQPTEIQEAIQEDPFDKMIRLADGGDLDAQLSLAYIYLYGEGDIKTDYKKAFHYYKLAADQKDNVAINNLGSLYYSGIGTPKDIGKAVEMFRTASQLGNVEAAVNLAFLYLTGNGVAKDSVEAMTLFADAAQKDNPTAQFMLGYAYYTGFHVPLDYGQAFEQMEKAAKAKFDDAQFMLAQMYTLGQGVPQNYGKAVKLYNQARLQGHLQAMMTLGDILSEGTKFKMDIYNAHIMYNLASVRGAPDAAEKREAMSTKMQIDLLLQAQAAADTFRERPSELTSYIHQTFGNNIRGYIDDAKAKEEKAKAAAKAAAAGEKGKALF